MGNFEEDEEYDENNYFTTPPNCNNSNAARKSKHKKRKTTINPDLFFGAEVESGDADKDDNEGGNEMNDNDGPTVEPIKYGMANKADWTMLINGGGQLINPVPYTGEAEHFGIKLEDGNLDKLRNARGTIRYHKVFKWLLPAFDEDGFYEFVAVEMINDMIQIIQNSTYRLSYSDPMNEKYITADHVACFFGCQLVRAIKGLLSIDDCWSTCELLDAVGTAKESMPCVAFYDMMQCMHFADDWEDEDGDEWEDTYGDMNINSPADVAHHCCKFAIIEDAFNARWKAAVIF